MAKRHLDSSDGELARKARRSLALALGHSTEVADKDQAISLYRSLTTEANSEASDTAMLATLLSGASRYEEAKSAVLGAIEKFPDKEFRIFRDRTADRGGDRRQDISPKDGRDSESGAKVTEGNKSFKVGIDFESVLRAISKQIYETPLAFIRENVQNAVDAIRI